MLEDKMSASYLANGPILHPSPTNYQSNNLQLRTPQIFQFTNVKQEPLVDDEKIDSGINSGGSDFQSSSPGSDQSISGDYGNAQPQYFSTPKIVQIPAFPQQLLQQQQQPQQLLTPPNSEPLISPKSGDCDETTLTPCSSPGTISNHDDSEIGNNSDNNDIKVPKISSSSSKTKFMKCKQCKFVCTTKEVFWDHMKIHIREDKRLSCTQCNFVTEYKHHLEYHLRNHAGSKPFKCPNCNYTCVNKSMLNSHMKSHSNIYQYHCADCNYATKYCHSLKLHLRKHRHQPGLVLDQDGKPNPLPIIDVYGTRRGPKMKSKPETADKSKQTQQEPTNFPTPFIPPQLSLAFSLLNQFPNPDVAAHLNQLIIERQLPNGNETESDDLESESSQGVLDLSQPSTSTSTTGVQQSRNRRKGPAFKLVKTEQGSDTDNETNSEISLKEEIHSDVKIVDDVVENNNENRCKHCDMAFGDQVLYTLHMSLHGKNDPFTCNACGIKCENRIAFYVHITRYAH